MTTELDQTVTIIDPKSLKIIGTIPTGQAESHMLALSNDGLRGYTANVGPGTVSVLDIQGAKEHRGDPCGDTHAKNFHYQGRSRSSSPRTRPSRSLWWSIPQITR